MLHSRFLMNEYRKARDGKKTVGTWSYLTENHTSPIIRSPEDCKNLPQLVRSFKKMAK